MLASTMPHASDWLLVWHLVRIVSLGLYHSLMSLSRVQRLQVVESFVRVKWIYMVIMRFVVTMELH